MERQDLGSVVQTAVSSHVGDYKSHHERGELSLHSHHDEDGLRHDDRHDDGHHEDGHHQDGQHHGANAHGMHHADGHGHTVEHEHSETKMTHSHHSVLSPAAHHHETHSSHGLSSSTPRED
jgi:hypothetical protein